MPAYKPITKGRIPKFDPSTNGYQYVDTQLTSTLSGAVGDIAGTLTEDRTYTLPDASGTVALLGGGGAGTTNRLVKFSSASTMGDSAVSDGITGAVLTLLGALTTNRTYNIQDAPGTIALLEQIQTWTAAQRIETLVAQKIYPNADSTTALQMLKADGATVVMNIDTTNRRVSFGTTTNTHRVNVGGGHLNFVSVTKPTAAPTAALAGLAGNVPNSPDTRYRYTYLTAFGETDFPTSYASVAITDKTVNGQVDVTVTGSTDPAVTHARIYRTSVAYGSVNAYFFLADVANVSGGTMTYRDNKTDAQLGTDRSEARDNTTTAQFYKDGSRILYVINNVLLGPSVAPSFTTATQVVGAGSQAINALTTGSYLVALGALALNKLTTGNFIVSIGASSGASNISGTNDVYLGHSAGASHTGSYCIVIGPNAGGTWLTTQNYRLIIDVTNTATPLIDGDFSGRTLTINGDLGATVTNAATNTVSETLNTDHESSGTVAASFGSRFAQYLMSSTTARQLASAIDTIWTTATHASRTAKMVLSVALNAVETVRMVISSTVQIGDIAGGNYSEFEADGTLKFVGDAKVWDDLRVEPVARTTGNNAPAFEKYYDDVAGTSRGVYLYSFDDAIAANEKEIFFTMQMPHGWAQTAIDIHVHWVGAVDDTTAEPRWGLEYVWQNIGNVYGDTTTIYAATKYPADANVTANKHYLTEFAAISPGTTANGISSVLIGRLFRNSSDAADTYDATGAKCGLLYIDAHYEIDTIGSRSELSK